MKAFNNEVKRLKKTILQQNIFIESLQKAHEVSKAEYEAGLAEIKALKEQYKSLVESLKIEQNEYKKQMKTLINSVKLKN